jgi:DNA (cytosine-5)-methyltransferase 1
VKVGSLFTGIGGLDLGLEWSGMEIVWQVERDAYCQKVLKKHWPEVPCYGDIKEIDFTTLPAVDLICGGFPCQPVSCAGKRQGDKDERWLWPEFYRAICEARPRWVVVENVPGLLSTSDGRLFGGILGDLARGGYDAEWDLLPAAAFGAPHLRYRVFLVANTAEPNAGGGARKLQVLDRHPNGGNGNKGQISEMAEGKNTQPTGICPDVSHTDNSRLINGGNTERRYGDNLPEKRQSPEDFQTGHIGKYRVGKVHKAVAYPQRIFQRGDKEWWASWLGWWEREPAEVIQDAGLRSWERNGVSIPESLLGRVAHGIPSRVDRLKCLGNAVVPQVAEWIGKRIRELNI